MLSLSHTAALVLCAGALVAGALLGWTYVQLRVRARFVARSEHSAELVSMRRRYRRRLRAVRDAMTRHRQAEERTRAELRDALARQCADAKQLDDARSDIASLKTRLAALGTALGEADGQLAAGQERERSLEARLREVLEKVAAFEQEHGLLRIERDELVARTQRLRTLTAPVTAPDAPAEAAEAPAHGPTRAEIADRDARIHELECQLRERNRRLRELDADLHRWKYRIAPLALHLRRKRGEQAQADTPEGAATPAPERRPDDLTRIRGIGRGLDKKLRAEGVLTYADLAAMAPAELANLATRIGVAATRPLRERWVEQAREKLGLGDEHPAHAEAG